MPAVATKQENKQLSSYRFRPRITGEINHYSALYKRKKTSIVEEALEQYFEREEKKLEEIIELRRLVQAGRDSGSAGEMPSAQELIQEAKEKYKHL